MKRIASILCLVLTGIAGCDADRVAKLEKDNVELKARVDQQKAALEYDLQAKCAKDAKEWFRDNYPPDKDTVTLIYIDHYNRKLNTCFIRAAFQFRLFDGSTSWHTTIWNVYENSQYADISENHDFKNKEHPDQVNSCEVQGQKCTNRQQFDQMTNSLLHD